MKLDIARIGVSLLAAVGLLVWGAAPFWWLGVGLLVFAGLEAWPMLREYGSEHVRNALSGESKLSSFLIRVGPHLLAIVLLCAVATWLMGDAALSRPAQSDHASHFAKAFMIKDVLLDAGTPFGWTHDWFTGLPLGYRYPLGGTLWVLAVDLVTLGFLPEGTVYGVAIFGFLVFYGYCVYLVGREVGGPWVGIVAAAVAMADPGGGRAGGWKWAMDVGVWPNSLSMAFSLLALSQARRVLETRSLAAPAVFALAMGLSLITHPMQLFFFACMGVTLVGVVTFGDRDRRGRGLLRLAVAHGLGAGVALAWLGPFLSIGGEPRSSRNAWWDTAHDLGVQLFDFAFLPGWGAGFIALALIGGFFAWRRSQTGRTVVLVCAVVAITSNATFLDELHLASWLESLQNVQFLRATIMVRPLFAVFVATLLVVAFEQLHVRVPRRRAMRIAVATGAGFLAPVLVGFVTAAAAWGPLPGLVAEEDWSKPADRAALAEFIREELPDEPFYRVAYFWGRGSSKPLAMTGRIDKPWFKTMGGTPAVPEALFPQKVISRKPAVLRIANVRYLVHNRPVKRERFELVERFGRLRIYEYSDWRPEPFTIDGEGEVTVTRFDRERIVLEATEGATGTLTLHVSEFPRWSAFVDGREVEIESAGHRAGRNIAFMRVPLRPGTVEFVFERTVGDVLFQLLGLLSGLACVLLLLASARSGWRVRVELLETVVAERLAPLLESRWARPAVTVLVGSTATAFLLFAVLEPPGTDGDLVYDFTATEDATVTRGDHRCVRLFDRHLCGWDAADHVAPRPSRIEEKSTRRCINAPARSRSTLSVEYPDIPLGTTLSGHVGIPFPHRLGKRQSVRFSVLVDGERVSSRRVRRHRRTIPFEVEAEPGTHDVRFEIRSSKGATPFCFHAVSVR